VEILADVPGTGNLVRRRDWLRIRLRLWLRRGDPVRWTSPAGFVGESWLEDDSATLVSSLRYDRRSLIGGLFQGIEGMRVGGTRRLSISPHLAYGKRGVPGVIPGDAHLTAEVTILAARPSVPAGSG
jgi:hypothetical protein